jgi:quinone-modifying oxidoreductase subunit QmoB
MANTKKIGVYICSGFDIGEVIDCEKLAEDMQKDENVAFCKIIPDLMTSKGAEQVKKDIESEELDAVIIGGSSMRYHTELFKFNGTWVERVNLREGVAWTHEPKTEGTQMLALDYMKMGLAKALAGTLPVPAPLDINDTILVVGGGYTGMNAAIAAAKAGYSVVITEKEAQLGGYYRKMYKITPTKAPYMDPEPNTCEELVAEIESHPKIEVLKNCTIEKTNGQPGLFDVTAKVGETTKEFQVGAIIQATGFRHTKTKKLEHLGYGKIKNVVTNYEMEELAKNGNIKRQFDGEGLKSVVFIQCAGSRDLKDQMYCSTVCCMTSLKQAMYVREKYPDARIYIIYKDMRTPGNYEMFYKRVQNEDNIFLTKGELKDIREDENGNVILDIDETLLGENIEISADLVVLASGMVPSTLVEESKKIADTPDKAIESTMPAAPVTEEAGDDAAAEEAEAEIEAQIENAPRILNLTYRQGPDLPLLKYGFPDSHYICFPYETRRTGIYAAGTVRSPMDLVGCKEDAYGAALKAIQCIEGVREGIAVHPRAGEKAFAEFFLQRCTQCKRCTEECPFGTLDEDKKGTPLYNPNRCRRCGICMGACPERIISFQDYSVHIVSQMIKSIYVPTEEEDGEATPRIIAFMCENDAYPSLDIAARAGTKISDYIRIIPVRCLGSVNTSWIADSLSQGFDGAILIGCKFGDDYQCHYIKGSELANKRMENVQEKLKQLVLEPERVELHQLAIDEYDKIPEILNNFAKVIEEVGPNPYKEM